nr:hypothetical protein Iba_chr09eCG4030 [Ipomoea batatas]
MSELIELANLRRKSFQIVTGLEAQVFQMLGHMEQSFKDVAIFNLNVRYRQGVSPPSQVKSSKDHSQNSDPAPYPDNPSDVPLGIVCASPQSHFAVSFAHHGIA